MSRCELDEARAALQDCVRTPDAARLRNLGVEFDLVRSV